MSVKTPGELEQKIINKAKELGATLVGIADADSLRKAPSYEAHGEVNLKPEVKSILALALEHKESEPELDYWDGMPGGTPGNRKLMEIAKGLKQLLESGYNIKSDVLSYTIREGGTFLKDAGVLAGLGIIGKNNLLITPEFGPRVRLGALAVFAKLEPTGPIEFSPCDGCDMPCRKECPQDAFREGAYGQPSCKKQMTIDEENISQGKIKYCRKCELGCVVGK